MKRTITSIILLMTLTACTVAWGASYNVVAWNQDMIRYEYELTSVSRTSMDKAAQKHCEQYNKDAVFQGDEEGGYEYIATYRCMAVDPLWQ